MKYGVPLDWRLQERVALIDDAIWRQGAAAVAEEIARIEQRIALETEAAALRHSVEAMRQHLRSLRAELGHGRIGDNGGPPLEDVAEVVEDLDDVAGVLPAVQVELAKPVPDASKLRAFGTALRAGGMTCLLYCGRKGDMIVDELIKSAVPEIGKWGARAAIGAIFVPGIGLLAASHSETVFRILDFAMKLQGP